MKHASQSQFGRTAEFCSPPSAPHDGLHDKWTLLSLLSDGAKAYDLSHRTLGVLRALLTFLPERMISPVPQGAIVFPSNKTLSTRLNGMPESTIRRHITKLIKAGIVSRHDSANRKRFARNVKTVGQIAFGFDLSPLARESEQINANALTARQLAEEHARLRAKLASLRQQMIEHGGANDLVEDAFRALRRKPDGHILTALCDQISGALKAKEMSSSDTQNERHIQIEDKYISDSVSDPEMRTSKKNDIELLALVSKCQEYKGYFPSEPTNWHDLIHIADRLTPMIGIDRPVFEDAIRVMGLKRAATVILCILERIGSIHNPGGYLRRQTQMARSGRLFLGNWLSDDGLMA